MQLKITHTKLSNHSNKLSSLRYVNGGVMRENKQNKLNQYFTKPEVAKHLIHRTQQIVLQYENIEKYTYIEPSVGEGAFYELLPSKKIGIDVEPRSENIIKSDYLEFTLPKNKPLIVIGNPPFGHRGVLALEFIHHSREADFVCFILPMFFQSLGKGSIRYRVKDLHLLYEETLPHNSFYTPEGKDADIKACFQIWSKKYKKATQEFSWYRDRNNEPFGDLLKVVTVSLAKNRECGKEWIFEKKADYYLSSTFFKNVTVVDSFEKVNYKSGIGIILTTKDIKLREKLKQILETANWLEYCSIATNGCKHIGKSHIFKLLTDNGF